MDLVKSCLVLTFAFALLAQSVLAAPAMEGVDMEEEFPGVIEIIMDSLRERRGAEESPVLHNRIRKSLAQMYQSYEHNRRDHKHSERRPHPRWSLQNRFFRRGHGYGGQVAES